MSVQQLDVIIRVAGATLLIVAAVMRANRTGSAGAVYFAALALCICGFLAGNTPDPDLMLSGPAGRVAVLLSGLTAVFLWWFCLSVFDWTFRPRGVVLYAGLVWVVVACADRGVFGAALGQRDLSWGLIVMGLGMVAHLAWRLYADRTSDLIDHRRRVRVLVVVLLAGQLLADMAVDVVLGLDWQARGFTVAQNLALLVFAGWLLTLEGARGVRSAQPGSATGVRPIIPIPDGDPSGLGLRLKRLIEVERVHLDPALDLATFVRLMGASERPVRQLINQRLGYDHFRTFVNAQRMIEARRLLVDPARRNDKLIVIAMDSGFASLPSFNRIFQSFETISPGAFRRAALEREQLPESEKPEAAGI